MSAGKAMMEGNELFPDDRSCSCLVIHEPNIGGPQTEPDDPWSPKFACLLVVLNL